MALTLTINSHSLERSFVRAHRNLYILRDAINSAALMACNMKKGKIPTKDKRQKKVSEQKRG